MTGRIVRLQRLLTIRRLVEELDRQRLEVASSAVAEVRTAIKTQQESVASAADASRRALSAGDRSEWLMADAQREVSGWNCGRLGALLHARELDLPPAVCKFIESRRSHEQVKLIVDSARAAERIDEDRKAQAAADDWFLGRRVRALARRS